MYVFGIDIQLNVLLGIAFLINLIELILVIMIWKKLRRHAERMEAQKGLGNRQ